MKLVTVSRLATLTIATIGISQAVRFAEVAQPSEEEAGSSILMDSQEESESDFDRTRPRLSVESEYALEEKVSTSTVLEKYLLQPGKLEESTLTLNTNVHKHDGQASTAGDVASKFAIPQLVHATSHYPKDCLKPFVTKHMMIDDARSLQITSDADNIEFLEKHFGQKTVDAYRHMRTGPHKADLYRYAKLYIDGGIYMDIKTMMNTNPLDVFKAGTSKFTWYGVVTTHDWRPIEGGRIYNGMIATPPRNPVLMELIETIVNNPPPSGGPWDYEKYVWNFTSKIKTGIGNDALHRGTFKVGNTTLNLLEERCHSFHKQWNVTPPVGCTKSRMDHYGLCCQIFDVQNNLVAFTRDPSYPGIMGNRWHGCKGVKAVKGKH